jgi:hypothetical protein
MKHVENLPEDGLVWVCGLASVCSHSARGICRWKGGGRRRRWQCGGGGDVTCCPIGSGVWICMRYKQRKKRTKIHVSFIYKISIAIAIYYSLPSCLIRFPYGHACIPFSSPRCLCITHSSRHLQYECAIVICYIMDDSWRKCRLLDHGYNAVAMTLGSAAMLCSGFCTGSWRKRSKRVEYCGSIRTVRPLPDKGTDVCIVRLRSDQKCGFV